MDNAVVVLVNDTHKGDDSYISELENAILGIAVKFEKTTLCFESWSNESPFYDSMPNIPPEKLEEHVAKTRPDVRDYYRKIMQLLIRLSEKGIKTVPIDADNSDGKITEKFAIKNGAIRTMDTTESFDQLLEAFILYDRILGEVLELRESSMKANVANVARGAAGNQCIIAIVGSDHVPVLQEGLSAQGFNVRLFRPVPGYVQESRETIKMATRGNLTDDEKLLILKTHWKRVSDATTLCEARAIFERRISAEKQATSQQLRTDSSAQNSTTPTPQSKSRTIY